MYAICGNERNAYVTTKKKSSVCTIVLLYTAAGTIKALVHRLIVKNELLHDKASCIPTNLRSRVAEQKIRTKNELATSYSGEDRKY